MKRKNSIVPSDFQTRFCFCLALGFVHAMENPPSLNDFSRCRKHVCRGGEMMSPKLFSDKKPDSSPAIAHRYGNMLFLGED